MSKRRLVLLVLTGIVALLLFFLLDIPEIVAFFQQNYNENPAVTVVTFIASYVIITLFGLPGAAILSVAAGLVFGLIPGIIYVSISSGISAVLSFLLGRYLLRDFVEKRFGEIHRKIDHGVAREGRFYLFFLRLVPGIPFPVLNMIFGLTSMNLFTYWWISQIGLLPIMTLLVNAGTGMTDLSSPAGVITPKTVISLAVIGLIPVAVKWIHLKFLKRPVIEE